MSNKNLPNRHVVNNPMSSAVSETQKSKVETRKSELGFWLYLMSDCLLFAALFATFLVLKNNTADGPRGHEIFEAPLVLKETLILLISSFTTGLGLLFLNARKPKAATTFFFATFALGVSFLGLELNEFRNLALAGHSWQQSAFLSSYFALVGTHGLHITAGLVWLASLLFRITRQSTSQRWHNQAYLFSLFWHFLDLVWIFIFSVVYLGGLR